MKKATLMVIGLALAIASCKKDKDDDAAPAPSNNTNTGVTVNSPDQVSFKLDGAARSHVVGATVQSSVGSSGQIATWPDTSQGAWGFGLNDMNTFDDIFELEKGYLRFVGNKPDSNQFHDFFANGSSAFVVNPDVQMGVKMAYWISGVKWSTDQGTGVQTGSSFTVTARKKWWSWSGNTGTTILANFNCILYDGMGNSKTVTDGVVVGSFENM